MVDDDKRSAEKTLVLQLQLGGVQEGGGVGGLCQAVEEIRLL